MMTDLKVWGAFFVTVDSNFVKVIEKVEDTWSRIHILILAKTRCHHSIYWTHGVNTDHPPSSDYEARVYLHFQCAIPTCFGTVF